MKVITPDIDCWYIDTEEELNDLVDVLIYKGYLACDTETYVDLSKINASALDPHSSKISLIQISWQDNICPYIIDVIRIGIEGCKRLIDEVFMNPDIVKVFHNARFDIKQFKGTFGVWIKNVHCTMALMKSLGICTGYKSSQFRGHRLLDMCRDLFGVILDKTEAKSQWGARPLTNSQIGYSALDVGALKDDEQSCCYILDAYHNIVEALELLEQDVAYIADQQAMYISAKMEWEGMYIDLECLDKVHDFAEELTNNHRQALVEELGFTIYNDLDINDDGEWVQVQVIPDKIKKLLNNNKQLVNYVNNFLVQAGAQSLSSLQAEEVKNYLDVLEKDVKEDEKFAFDEDFFNAKYDGISLIKNLLEYKKYSKLLSECEKYRGIVNPNSGMVHAGFNAVGTSTGRMSSSGSLNLQQVSNTKVKLELYPEDF